MRTNDLRTAAGRALALLGVLAALTAPCPAAAADAVADPAAAPAAVAAPPAAAASPAADKIAEASVSAGYRVWDADDNKSRTFPYAPLTDGPVLDLRLLYLTPTFGTLDLEGFYQDDDSWFAEAEYHRGAKLDVHVLSQKSALAREPLAPLPDLNIPNPNIDAATGLPLDPIETESHVTDKDAEYSLTRQTSEFALKVRAPGYPAHLRASGRITERGGSEQLNWFYRSCGTHMCHTNSRSVDIDQRTEEFSLGADAHLGPVDLAYTHTQSTFRDQNPAPVDYYADAKGSLMAYPPSNANYGPGDYEHAVNPDLKSHSNQIKLNTNLANRTVLSLAWRGDSEENESAGITRDTQRVEAAASHTFSRELFATLRAGWQHIDTSDLSDEARQQRVLNNKYHQGQNHKHVVEPDDTQTTADLTIRWEPVPRAQIKGLLGYSYRKREVLLEQVKAAYVDDPPETRETTAGLTGRYRLSEALTFDANLKQSWTDDPAYANENTSLTNFGAGATWTPAPLFTLQASYQGYRGENDDEDSLGAAYDVPPPYPLHPRNVDGNAYSVSAVVTPAETLNVTASWTYNDSGIEQDLILGAFTPPKFAYYSPDTDWSGTTQTVSLRASWAASKRLTLTGEGMWIHGHEYYDPNFRQDAYLEDIGSVEFIKTVATLAADVRFSERLGLTVSGSYADYNDQVDDANDGSALGVLAAVNVKW